MADVKDPQKLVDRIAREENEADAAIIPNLVKRVKEAGSKAIDYATKEMTAADIDKYVADKQAANKAAKRRADSVETKRNTGENTNPMGDTFKKGGKVKSASARADGCCIRGKTRA
jgi:hypothetical protein